MSDVTPPQFLTAPPHNNSKGEKIAYRRTEGRGPTVMWCGGLKSDMLGGKATHLHDWALANKRDFIRFDYFGHGESSGRFRDGTISRWSEDVIHVIDNLAAPDVVLIGSSMGGWSSLLAAMARPERVKGLVLIAPAPDFTEKLMWAHWSDDVRATIETEGIYYEPSDYDEPYEYSRELIEDGRARQILDQTIPFSGPVRILQGLADDVVPWDYAYRVVDTLQSENVTMTLVKGGDHSLSRPEDLLRLQQTVERILTEL